MNVNDTVIIAEIPNKWGNPSIGVVKRVYGRWHSVLALHNKEDGSHQLFYLLADEFVPIETPDFLKDMRSEQ
jgi:hypothetical protein